MQQHISDASDAGKGASSDSCADPWPWLDELPALSPTARVMAVTRGARLCKEPGRGAKTHAAASQRPVGRPEQSRAGSGVDRPGRLHDSTHAGI